MEKIPFVDLYAQYLTIRDDINRSISNVITDTAFIGGAYVTAFEAAFAQYLEVDHVVSCANGTDSMEIILKAWGVGHGDEVLVPANSWISTAEAVGNVGARPVFVDVDPLYYTIDTALIESAITANTKAIIPVHLYGHPADMPAIMVIAERHRLQVLEDCAQSHGASIEGKRTGTFGHAASFSFYPGKNLGAYGDAGCMATNDAILAAHIRMIANHGQKAKHNHLIEGRNSRLDGLHAAILSAKLPHLDDWNRGRQKVSAAYSARLEELGIDTPMIKEGYFHAFHLYVVRTDHRDALSQHLKANGIETAIHYPTALPFLPCYAHMGYKPADFPVAFTNQSQILSLPIFAEMTPTMVDRVLDAISTFEYVPTHR